MDAKDLHLEYDGREATTVETLKHVLQLVGDEYGVDSALLRLEDSFDGSLAPDAGSLAENPKLPLSVLVRRDAREAGLDPDLSKVQTIGDLVTLYGAIEKARRVRSAAQREASKG